VVLLPVSFCVRKRKTQIIRLKSNREYKPSSQYLGVNLDKQTQKWRASISVDGRKKILGYFDNEEEAARVKAEPVRGLTVLHAPKIDFGAAEQ
jgi:hypothetical protein